MTPPYGRNIGRKITKKYIALVRRRKTKNCGTTYILNMLNNKIDVWMMKSGRDYMMWKLELKVRRKKKG
jgi:hypothetical protein